MLARITRKGRFEYNKCVLSPARNRSGAAYHFLSGHWLFPPYARTELHVSRTTALGDVLMCTPALKAAKRANPQLRLNFYTDYPDLMRGLPFLDVVLPSADAPPQTIRLSYEDFIPPRRHIAAFFGDLLGVRVRDVRPSIATDPDILAKWRIRFAALPRPIIAVSRRAGPWTPNKDWPAVHWSTVIPELARSGSVVEIGQRHVGDAPFDHPNYHDLREQTPLADLIGLLAASDVHIGPISGPVHIAAALGIPSVVIYGGYEDPICSSYLGNVNLTNQPSCSPCWLRTPCPYDRKCLRDISPERVINAVWQVTATPSGSRGSSIAVPS